MYNMYMYACTRNDNYYNPRDHNNKKQRPLAGYYVKAEK